MGRYLRFDPIGLRAGINLFLYAINNPLKYKDTLGLLWCGSGWTEWLVPDKPAGYDFSECCRKHDFCYDGKNDDYGNDQCWKLQEDCDREFYECMKEVCSQEKDDEYNRYMPEYPDQEYLGRSRSECERMAKDYKKGVDMFGRKPFDRARKRPPCSCKK